jgi:hypothetical protein
MLPEVPESAVDLVCRVAELEAENRWLQQVVADAVRPLSSRV